MKKTLYSLTIVAAALTMAGAVLSSCSRDELPAPTDELPVPQEKPAFEIAGNPVDARLNIVVGGLSSTLTTRAEKGDVDSVTESEAEKQINDLWVFQYDGSKEDGTNQLIMIPQYLTIDNQEDLANLQVKLSDNGENNSIIYVVANTSDPAWVTYDSQAKNYTGFMTLAELKAHTIPSPEPMMLTYDYAAKAYVSCDENDQVLIHEPGMTKDGSELKQDDEETSVPTPAALSLPMAGFIQAEVKTTEVNPEAEKSNKAKLTETEETGPITVKLERMYAKLCIRVDLTGFDESETRSGGLVDLSCRTGNEANPAGSDDLAGIIRGAAYESVHLDNITVGNIPYYSTVGPLWSEENQTAAYPEDCQWLTKTFAANEPVAGVEMRETSQEAVIYPYVIYVPENIQGETVVAEPAGKASAISAAASAPEHALFVTATLTAIPAAGNVETQTAETIAPVEPALSTILPAGTNVMPLSIISKTEDADPTPITCSFTAYPGGKTGADYNVRRNCVYFVTMKITAPAGQQDSAGQQSPAGQQDSADQ